MSEVKKIATRESYGNALAELGAQNPNIVVLDADLAGATKTGVFKKAFPELCWHVPCRSTPERRRAENTQVCLLFISHPVSLFRFVHLRKYSEKI